jgi:glycosyltransferase involved in cell wall biosynthesis
MRAPRATWPVKLKIAHVFRAPLGGLFRHVLDLAAEQIARGHEVGMFFDAGARDARVEAALAKIPGGLTLGVGMTPIRRNPGPSDMRALARFSAWVRDIDPDVVHGHGSKGGVLARTPGLLSPGRGPLRAYTPHGGSFNYNPGGALHRGYMAAERLLASATDVFLFESAYIAGRFDALVGARTRVRRVVPNGLRAGEFALAAHRPDAAELLYVGELRAAKGIDTLLDALALVAGAGGRTPRLVLVGTGPEREMLAERARRLGVADSVTFAGPMPIRDAMALGQILVVPSRAESMPYVVLEAAAARMPMIATNVGGIPEIYGPFRDRLGPAGDPEELRRRILSMLELSAEQRDDDASDLAFHVAENFTIEHMADAVLSGYREGFETRLARPTASPVPRVHSNS